MPNINPDKAVKFTSNGREWTFYYGNASLRSFENDSGMAINDVFEKGISIHAMSMLFLHGLKTVQPEVTLEDVDEICDFYGLQELAEKATEAVSLALPSARGNGKAPIPA